MWYKYMVCSCACTGGTVFLCMQDKNGFHPADLLLLCCAFGFSIQILFVDYFSPKVDGVRLSMIQFLVTGVLTSVPMFVVDMQHSIPGIEVWAQAFYHGRHGFRFYMQELCPVGLDIHCRSLVRMG